MKQPSLFIVSISISFSLYCTIWLLSYMHKHMTKSSLTLSSGPKLLTFLKYSLLNLKVDFQDGLLFIGTSRIFRQNVTTQFTIIMKVCLGRKNKHVRREVRLDFEIQKYMGFFFSFPYLYIHYGYCSFVTPVENDQLPCFLFSTS